MDAIKKIMAPLSDIVIGELSAGDSILLSGKVYTARDAAHKRLIDLLTNGEKLPFDPAGQIIYYTGPCPSKNNETVGSAGPTTSYRMDKYTPALLSLGLKGMIGKGARSNDVINAITKYKAVYFAAIGGAGAMAASHIISQRIITFDDLGAEAIYEMYFDNMLLFVAIDSKGRNIYKSGRDRYREPIIK